MPPVEPLKALAGLRALVGAGSWLAPELSGRVFGIDPKRNPQAPYVARLFGIRDLALAAGALGSEGQARALWVKLGIACDLADAAAGVIAGRRRELPPFSSVVVTAVALSAAGFGTAALRAEPK